MDFQYPLTRVSLANGSFPKRCNSPNEYAYVNLLLL